MADESKGAGNTYNNIRLTDEQFNRLMAATESEPPATQVAQPAQPTQAVVLPQQQGQCVIDPMTTMMGSMMNMMMPVMCMRMMTSCMAMMMHF